MEKPPVKYRISRITQALLLLVVVIADGVQAIAKILIFTGFLIPLSEAIGWFVSLFCFAMLNVIYFSVGLFSGHRKNQRLLAMAVSLIVETIPVINAFPMLTIGTIYTTEQSRAEDREKAKQDATIEMRRPGYIRQSGRGRNRTSGVAQRSMRRKLLSRIPHPAARAILAADMALEKRQSSRLRPRTRPISIPRAANDNTSRIRDAA